MFVVMKILEKDTNTGSHLPNVGDLRYTLRYGRSCQVFFQTTVICLTVHIKYLNRVEVQTSAVQTFCSLVS